MDIPIRFKFFDKLKLYQDYLKEGSMLEKTKGSYWLCGKSFLFWGYSEDHQHFRVPLSSKDTFAKDKRAKKISEIAEKIGGDNYEKINWVKEKITNETEMKQVLGNLIVLEFATEFISFPKDTPEKDTPEIIFSLKGFLLGELLFETYEKPGFWSKNFKKYKLALLVFYATFIALFITVFLVFGEHLFHFIKSKYFVTTGVYIRDFLNSCWWVTIMTYFLIFLGLRQIWKRL